MGMCWHDQFVGILKMATWEAMLGHLLEIEPLKTHGLNIWPYTQLYMPHKFKTHIWVIISLKPQYIYLSYVKEKNRLIVDNDHDQNTTDVYMYSKVPKLVIWI